MDASRLERAARALLDLLAYEHPDFGYSEIADLRAALAAPEPAQAGEAVSGLLRKADPKHAHSALAIQIVEAMRGAMPEDFDDAEDIASAYGMVDGILSRAVRTSHATASAEAVAVEAFRQGWARCLAANSDRFVHGCKALLPTQDDEDRAVAHALRAKGGA